MQTVEILEVAPRDGFQSVKTFIPTATKIALIEGLAECGFKRLEIGSFVSPKALADATTSRSVLMNSIFTAGMLYELPSAIRSCTGPGNFPS